VRVTSSVPLIAIPTTLIAVWWVMAVGSLVTLSSLSIVPGTRPAIRVLQPEPRVPGCEPYVAGCAPTRRSATMAP
jgi:hypothetical protein